MNRRNFFKNLGAATVGVIVAPAIITKAAENISKPKRERYMNVDWNKVYPPARTITTYGDSTGGETPGATINIDVCGRIRDCPRVGYSLYYIDEYNAMWALYVVEVAIRPYYNSPVKLTLIPYSSDLKVGKGNIKDGTEMCIGGSTFIDPKTTDPPQWMYSVSD